jgi:hypothetical protein
VSPPAGDQGPAEPDRAALAIVAHGLLEDTAVVGTAAAMLLDQWEELGEPMRRRLVKMILENNAHVTWVLDGLARGVPLDALRAVPLDPSALETE